MSPLFRFLHQFAPLRLQLALADALLASLGKDDNKVECEGEEDEHDQLPTTQIACFRVWHKRREHDQTVAAHERQSLVDQVHRVGERSLKGTILAAKDHEGTTLEDHELDLEVAALDPKDDNQGIETSPQDKKEGLNEGVSVICAQASRD